MLHDLQRQIAIFPLDSVSVKGIKYRMLNWSKQFSILVFLDNNSYSSVYPGYECLLAAGSVKHINTDSSDELGELYNLHNNNKDWVFGHFCYEYKDRIESKLHSKQIGKVGFPLVDFFIPETVCYINRDKTQLTIESFKDPASIYNDIMHCHDNVQVSLPEISFQHTVDKETYLKIIEKIRHHIFDGDFYELNFCCEGFANYLGLEPLAIFCALNTISPAPFACYYKTGDKYMMCASPERYVSGVGNKVFSQPIKGTAPRSSDLVIDLRNKEELYKNIKERAENVMIVDLVRNDLARCCETGSIHVDELFGIYSFPQVHQMISTISGIRRSDLPFTDVFKSTFPMGSMTGAPKFKVMQIIEDIELSRRELFSGTIGYIAPSGDFDFNVVIRSLFYNASTGYLSYKTGGAITYDSIAENEWEEMRLKAWAMERIFKTESNK